MIVQHFHLTIAVFIIRQVELKEIVSKAPDWWGEDNKKIYDNLIFMLPDLTYDDFQSEIGTLKAEYEQAYHYKNAIFWSFSRKDYQKTNWWPKTANTSVSQKITIRTANTVRKIMDS